MAIHSIPKLLTALALTVPLFLIGCDSGGSVSVSGDDDDDGGGADSGGSARISGSVTLSSEVAGSNKPSSLLMQEAADSLRYQADPNAGIVVLNKPSISSELDAIPLMAIGDPVTDAFVYLYDAERPDWLSPVAQDVTNSSGDYSFEVYGCTDNVDPADCASDAANNDNEYVDGDPLPQGVYTMLIYKPSTFDPILGVTTDPIVSVLPAFRADDDDFEVGEAEAEVSDGSPNVVTMFGLEKNTDGTDSWGSEDVELPSNASIQVSFDMAMSRGSVQNIEVSSGGTVAGSWSLSADWLTATFEPDSDLTAGVYTITVPSSTVNVYSNAIGYESTGTFTALAAPDTTAPTVSVSSPSDSSNVPATTPIRLTSNESLNVNALRIESTPSIGDFPGVKLVDSDGVSFVYEVVVTEPLTLGTSYEMDFTDVQDGSGNAAADINLAFTTEAAADAEGVDAGADETTQNEQVAISDLFAKWILAVNERNPATIQSLMSGSFVFEYSVQAEDGFNDYDINRNGRLSLNEFMAMIEESTLFWEFCETTLTGTITDTVNITSATTGDFEFELEFESVNQSQDCSQGNNQTMYVSARKSNGLWKLTRMSEGFDHRGTTLTSLELIEAQLYEQDDSSEDGLDLVENWEQMDNYANEQTPLTFKFDHIQGIESYVFIVANERDPAQLGFAFIVNADRLACVDSDDNSCTAQEGDELEISVPDPFGDQGMPEGAYPILDFFGFDQERDWGIENPGEIFIWEVIGLQSITSQEMSGSSPPAVVDVVRDIAAVSAVKRFQNPGDFVKMAFTVEAFDSPLEYNIYNSGYDAGSADTVDITVVSPGDVSANESWLYVSSPIGWEEYALTFVYDGGSDTSTATIEDVQLFNGWSWIEVTNGYLWDGFQIQTTGGKQPDMTLFSITGFEADTTSSELLSAMDEWNYIDASSDALGTATGINELDVSWSIASGDGVGGVFDVDDALDMMVTQACAPSSGYAQMYLNVWNESGAYYSLNYCANDGTGPTNDISISGSTISLAANIPVFAGDNWISIDLYGDSGDGTGFYQTAASFGLYTDAGTEYVPAITLVSVDTTDTDPVEQIGDWGQGSDWDATDATDTTEEVTLTFEFDMSNGLVSPVYFGGSEGVCCSDGELSYVTDDGEIATYEMTITLYQGYNWFNIEDGVGNWYSVNIYTNNGAEVPRPKITHYNGVALPEPEDPFAPVNINVGVCVVTLEGTAPDNTEILWVNWSGGDDSEGFWEGQEINLMDAELNGDGLKAWAASFTLVGGANSYNVVDVYDEANNSWAGANINTSDTSCAYVYPELTVDGVELSDSTPLVDPEGDGYTWALDANYGGVTDLEILIYGTSTVPGRVISVGTFFCGGDDKSSTTADTVANGSGTYDWSIAVALYDDNDATANGVDVFESYQYFDISDGWNWSNITVVSDNNNVPTPSVTLDLPSGFTDESEGGCQLWWSANQDTSVTVTGNTTNEDAWGEFGEAYSSGGWVDFVIDEFGDFSFDIDLYDGENYIWVDDFHGGFVDLMISTSNGVFPPQYVFITSPTTTDVDQSGTVTVTGDFGDSGFVPDWLNAYVYVCDVDFTNCFDTYYDSELEVANEFGDLPMSLDEAGFSLSVDVPDITYSVFVDVYGCGAEGCHGHSLTFNDGGFADDENFYKPGGSGQPDYRHRTAR